MPTGDDAGVYRPRGHERTLYVCVTCYVTKKKIIAMCYIVNNVMHRYHVMHPTTYGLDLRSHWPSVDHNSVVSGKQQMLYYSARVNYLFSLSLSSHDTADFRAIQENILDTQRYATLFHRRTDETLISHTPAWIRCVLLLRQPMVFRRHDMRWCENPLAAAVAASRCRSSAKELE